MAKSIDLTVEFEATMWDNKKGTFKNEQITNRN